MTTSGKSSQGEGSVPSGLCSAPQYAERWLQVPTVPVQCVAVTVTLHSSPAKGVWCYSIETIDPHTRELLGHVLDPSRTLLTAQQMCSLISTDVRAVLLALTDPEPF